MTREELQKRLDNLRAQLRQVEAQFNYMNGVLGGQISLIEEMLKEPEPPANP